VAPAPARPAPCAVTVQARIFTLIGRLRAERGLAYPSITHNVAVVDRFVRLVPRAPGRARRGIGPDAAHARNHREHPHPTALREAVPELPAAQPAP
jgi:hypothetical protein